MIEAIEQGTSKDSRLDSHKVRLDFTEGRLAKKIDPAPMDFPANARGIEQLA